MALAGQVGAKSRRPGDVDRADMVVTAAVNKRHDADFSDDAQWNSKTTTAPIAPKLTDSS